MNGEPMMLWYKAWRESRMRFAMIAVAVAAICVYAVRFRDQIQANGIPIRPGLRDGAYSENIYQFVYSGTAKGVFALLVIFLGLGGLLRERAHRTAIFTLALPVSRMRLILTQIVVGLAEMAALALLPALLIPSLSPLVHQSFPLAEALHFSVLWFGCGTIIFASAFFLSVVFGGEYIAPVACYIALISQSLVAQWAPLRPYRLNLMWTMGEFGTRHWDPQHNVLLSSPLPWTRLLIIALIASGLFALSARTTQRQDF